MAVISHYSKIKLAIVNVDQGELAKSIEAALKSIGFEDIVMLDAPASYPGYFGVANAQARYTIFVDESTSCSVVPCSTEGFAHDRVGHYVKRNTDKSRKASGLYKHYLKMLELDPNMLGVYKIPFEEVCDLTWYYTDTTPMLYLKLPNSEGVAQAVCEAIRDYFKYDA